MDARVQRLAGGAVEIALDIRAEDLHFGRTGEKTTADLDVVISEELSGSRLRYERQRAQLGLPAGTTTDATTVHHAMRVNLQPTTTSNIKLLVRDRFTGRYGSLEIPAGRLAEK